MSVLDDFNINSQNLDIVSQYEHEIKKYKKEIEKLECLVNGLRKDITKVVEENKQLKSFYKILTNSYYGSFTPSDYKFTYLHEYI